MGASVGESLGLASPTGEDLPPERFPHLQRVIDDLFGGDADERFEFGIDVIVRGLATYAEPGEGRDRATGEGEAPFGRR